MYQGRLYDQPHDPTLARLVLAALYAVNDRVSKLEQAGRYLGTHFAVPTKVRVSPHGWPMVDEDDRTDFSGQFGLKSGEMYAFGYQEIPELAQVIDYILDDPAIRLRICDGEPSYAAVDKYAIISAAMFVMNLLDRARHTATALTDDLLTDLYLNVEPTLFEDKLPIDVVVPILLAKFDSDGVVHLDDGAALEHLDDDLNRARAITRRYYNEVNPFLVQAATHALVLQGYSLPGDYPRHIHRVGYWPTDTIDLFFRAMEVVQDGAVGYAQILARPRGWAATWRVDLPPLITAVLVRRYPPALESGGWNTDGTTYGSSAISDIAKTYGALLHANKSIVLAARRLGRASVRETDDDTIIDLCIGLEALFGERAAEVVHKLALRTATTLVATAQAVEFAPEDIFRAVKQIYDYRSRVVHGDPSAVKGRAFTAMDGHTYDVLALARTFLRRCIAATLGRPGFVLSGEVEKYILQAIATSVGAQSSEAT